MSGRNGISQNYSSQPKSRSTSKSPKKSTQEDFQAASAAVELEYNAVKRLKRLSIGNSLNFDPDLPPSSNDNYYLNDNNDSLTSTSAKVKLQTSLNSQLKRSKSKLSTHSVTYADSESLEMSLNTDDEISIDNSFENDNLSFNDALDDNNFLKNSDDDNTAFIDDNVEFLDLDPDASFGDSDIIWVPATAHPKISPENFRKHIQSSVDEINSKIQRSGSIKSSLHRETSLRKLNMSIENEDNEESDDDYDNSNNKIKNTTESNEQARKPSLRELTVQLETLSKRAGLDDNDAVTLARSLSTRSIGITKIEKEVYSQNDSGNNKKSIEINQLNDLTRARSRKLFLKNKSNKTRESLFIKDENDLNELKENLDDLVQMDNNKKSSPPDFVSNLGGGWKNYRRQQNSPNTNSNTSVLSSAKLNLPTLPQQLRLNNKKLQNHVHVYKDIRKIHNSQKPLGKPQLEPIKLKSPSSRLPDLPILNQRQQKQQQQPANGMSSPNNFAPLNGSPSSPTLQNAKNDQQAPSRGGYQQQQQQHQQQQQQQQQQVSRSIRQPSPNQNHFLVQQQPQRLQYQQQKQISHQHRTRQQFSQQSQKQKPHIYNNHLQNPPYQHPQNPPYQQRIRHPQQQTYNNYSIDERKASATPAVKHSDQHLSTLSTKDVQEQDAFGIHPIQPTQTAHSRSRYDSDQKFIDQTLQARNEALPNLEMIENGTKNINLIDQQEKHVELPLSGNEFAGLPIESNQFEKAESNDNILIKKREIKNDSLDRHVEVPPIKEKQDIKEKEKEREKEKNKDIKPKTKSSFSSFFKIKRDKPRSASSSTSNSTEEPKSTFKSKRTYSHGSESSGMSSPKADFISFFGGKKEREKGKEKEEKEKGKEKEKEKEKHEEKVDESTLNKETVLNESVTPITKKAFDVLNSSPKLSKGLFSLNKSSENVSEKREKEELKISSPVLLPKTEEAQNTQPTQTKIETDNQPLDKENIPYTADLNDQTTSTKGKFVTTTTSSLLATPSSSTSVNKVPSSSTQSSPTSSDGAESIDAVDTVNLNNTSSLENPNEQENNISISNLKSTELIKKSLKETLERNERPTKPNQPLEMRDSAFGFPLPPVSNSTLLMLDHRFPVHVERAIYRLSHLKLADPKRPLRQQVLLSNFMYSYLNLVNHTLWIQSKEQEANEDDTNGIMNSNKTNILATASVS